MCSMLLQRKRWICSLSLGVIRKALHALRRQSAVIHAINITFILPTSHFLRRAKIAWQNCSVNCSTHKPSMDMHQGIKYICIVGTTSNFASARVESLCMQLWSYTQWVTLALYLLGLQAQQHVLLHISCPPNTLRSWLCLLHETSGCHLQTQL